MGISRRQGAFRKLVAKMPRLLGELQTAARHKRLDDGLRPIPGIYVFFERGKPLYVGRTNNVRNRIQAHTRPSSGHNSATFAFILARNAAKRDRLPLDGMTREEMEKLPRFRSLFTISKTRVAKMDIGFVEIDEANVQVVFEVYAAMVMNTPYNDFDNH